MTNIALSNIYVKAISKPYEKAPQINFMVGLTTNYEKKDTKVLFDKEISFKNSFTGDKMYDLSSGEFSAPIDGIYIFAVSFWMNG